ncbi:MAG: S16 family serine protease [Planctomycetota bacterium]
MPGPGPDLHHPIFVRVTGAGTGGIAALLLDGDGVRMFLQPRFRAKRLLADATTGDLLFGRLVDAQGRSIDEVLAAPLGKDDSETRNEQVELSCHGGVGVLAAVEEVLLEAGLARGQPTDLLRRAHLNARLSLLTIEARLRLPAAATARQAAVLVALRALGYHPRAVPAGAVVDATEPGAAGDSVLAVGDVITAVDSKSTPRLGPLTALVTATPPGTSLQFTFHRLGTTTTRQRSLVVGELERVGPASAPSYPCVGVGAKEGPVVRHAGRPQSCLPFGAEQLYKDEDEPFRVSIQADGIAGPSAGLSFTLGLVEKLDRADLTGGRRVAATGTMSNNGAVGAIGGVAQKTVAVREAGASVFLVPPANAAVARANAGPTLRVIAVSSIGQAVAALERLGGRLVPATGPR